MTTESRKEWPWDWWPVMAIALRGDYDAARLRRLARHSSEPDQVRRLLALAVIYDGASRADAAAVGGAASG